MTEHGYRWAMCQKHSDFIPPALFLNSKSCWAGGWGDEKMSVAKSLLAHFAVRCVTVKVVVDVILFFSVIYLVTYKTLPGSYDWTNKCQLELDNTILIESNLAMLV